MKQSTLVKLSALLILAALAVGVFAKKAQAAPQKGSILTITIDAKTGLALPYVPIYIRQLSGQYPEPTIRTTTNGVGQVWVAVFPGTYEINSRSATAPQIVSIASRQEIVVPLYVTSKGGGKGK